MLGKVAEVSLLTVLFHHPPRAAAAKVGDYSSYCVEEDESRWAGRRQALEKFEELKMSVILCTGMLRAAGLARAMKERIESDIEADWTFGIPSGV